MNALVRHLQTQIDQTGTDPHILHVAPMLRIDLRQSGSLLRCHLPVRIAGLAGTTPLDDELDGVDSKPGARWNLPHHGADQGKNAGGVAARDIAERRLKHSSRLLQGLTSLLAHARANPPE